MAASPDSVPPALDRAMREALAGIGGDAADPGAAAAAIVEEIEAAVGRA